MSYIFLLYGNWKTILITRNIYTVIFKFKKLHKIYGYRLCLELMVRIWVGVFADVYYGISSYY